MTLWAPSLSFSEIMIYKIRVNSSTSRLPTKNALFVRKALVLMQAEVAKNAFSRVLVAPLRQINNHFA